MARFPVKIAMLELEDQEKFHNRDFIARPSRAANFFATDAWPEVALCEIRSTASVLVGLKASSNPFRMLESILRGTNRARHGKNNCRQLAKSAELGSSPTGLALGLRIGGGRSHSRA